MIEKQKPGLSKDLTEALKQHRPHAKKGYANAVSAINMLESTVATASKELQAEIDRLKFSNIRDDAVYKSLTEQLSKIRSDYAILPAKLREDVDQLSKFTFTVTVFGRTMAGKSTLMEVLTHGDGSSIGHGAQRTTRSVRRYKYKNLQIVDVPGVAAFEGKDDEDVAFNEAKKADLIFFILKDEDVQPSVAECLSRIVSLGKPIVCLVNVKADIGSTDITPAKMKMFKRDLEKKMRREHLEGIKNQLFEFGHSYGQDWRTVRFAYVHLKASFLSQQQEYQEYASELYYLSRFDFIDQVIVDEITRNGGFYKLKAYTEIVAVPLVDSVETLFEQSAQNSQQGSLMIAKRKALSEWIREFTKSADTQIETFLTTVSSDLKKEVAIFAEDNYANKNASKKWNEVVKDRNIQQRAQKLLEQLGGECENELREITRETEFDIKFSYKLNAEQSLNMHSIVNGRRIWNWATSIVSGGLTIAGIFVASPLVIAGLGVGVLGWLGNLLFKDYESKAKNARKELERKLTNHINKMMNSLRKTMKNVLYDELLKKYMNPMETTMNEAVSSLFALSDVQHMFAKRLNGKLEETNKLVVTEALAYEGYEGLEYHINSLARIPGYAVMIALDDGKRFPDDARNSLRNLLKEQIWFVFQKDNLKSMLGQAIGKGCERSEIRIQDINGEPRIAHIPTLETVDAYTRNRIRMAQQLTGLLIMK